MKKSITISILFVLIYSFVACSHTSTNPVANSKAVITNIPEKTTTDSIQFAFYNVENLFDTIDDPKINDNEFLPKNKMQWTKERYNTKLRHISQVFEEMHWPAVIGLCEIENLEVLKDLISKTRLSSQGYDIVHYDSPDERGIDVALLYKKDIVKVLSSKAIRQSFPEELNDRTRDILHCVIELPNRQIVNTFVNHWPSRSSGQEKSEVKRVLVAESLKKEIDKILANDARANILAMGDLNDDPTNISISQKLGASKYDNTQNYDGKSLIDLGAVLIENGKGTLVYKESWNLFDQIIVNGNLLNKTNKIYSDSQQGIGKFDFVLYKSKNGEMFPSRTYVGTKYYGGYSDHLPAFVFLHMN
jgi:predicted extracellular nuclease